MTVPRMDAADLSLDPPVLHDSDALAVFSPASRSLVRCRSRRIAEAEAEIASLRGDAPAAILKGAFQLRSGLWYFPSIVEVVDARKALDPLKRKDRALLAKRLQREMVRAARVGEAAALEETLDLYLGTQWGTLTEAQLEAVYLETRAAIMTVGTTSAMKATTTRAGKTLLGVAERSRRAKVLGIPAGFRQADQRALARLNGNMPFFISNDYGRRVNVFVEQDALRLLARGTERGLSDRAIGRDLHRSLSGRVSGRTQNYFNQLSAISVVRSSTFGQLTSYEEAGILMYEWLAVMDGATCNICQMLHGGVFAVSDAMTQIRAASQPGRAPDETIMEAMPFYREYQGAIHVASTERGGPIGQKVADVVRSGLGRPGNLGTFTIARPPQGSGATESPPAHGLCRCITSPVWG